MKNKKPSEIISRGVVGEIVAPLNLPPDLARLFQEWEKLTYDQKVADVRKRPLEDRLGLLKSVGGICKNAIQLVVEFRPLIEVCRDELSQRGRRIPVEGKPTWTEFIPATFGCGARRMQQLLADGATSGESLRSKPVRPKKTGGSTSSNGREQTEQVLVLAVRLARSLVDHGLGDRFPEAAEIMRIVNSKGETRSSTPGGVTNGHHVSGPQ